LTQAGRRIRLSLVIGLIVIVGVVALPLAYMIWRFERGGDAVLGGSHRELLGRDDDEPGPQSQRLDVELPACGDGSDQAGRTGRP
jgi:hypothetical protein